MQLLDNILFKMLHLREIVHHMCSRSIQACTLLALNIFLRGTKCCAQKFLCSNHMQKSSRNLIINLILASLEIIVNSKTEQMFSIILDWQL